MKTKLILLLVTCLMGFTTIEAQECTKNLSLFNDSAKAKIYDDALPRYKKLIEECPKESVIIYQRADKMFDDLISKETDEAKKKEYAEMAIENLKLRMQYFPSESPKGQILPDIGKIMYENKFGTADEMFKYFDDAWNEDNDNFKSPVGLYMYFILYDKMVDSGKKTINELFVKYDEVISQIERMDNEQAALANPLVIKQENGEQLTSKESRTLKNSGIYLRNYAKIKKGINNVLGEKANCENLIPMFNKDFEERKGDKDWLRIAASKMSSKDCTDDPLFFKLVEALHQLEPSAKTAYYLGRLALSRGDTNTALDYFKNAVELEEDPLDMAKYNFSIAEIYKDKGAYSTARRYYDDALENKPSLGIAHLRIADMIAKSANNCGDSTFNKRAVYWLAEKYAKRAGSADPNLKQTASETAKSYAQRAPSKSDIFQEGAAGKTITFSCWVGGSVKVPSI